MAEETNPALLLLLLLWLILIKGLWMFLFTVLI